MWQRLRSLSPSPLVAGGLAVTILLLLGLGVAALRGGDDAGTDLTAGPAAPPASATDVVDASDDPDDAGDASADPAAPPVPSAEGPTAGGAAEGEGDPTPPATADPGGTEPSAGGLGELVPSPPAEPTAQAALPVGTCLTDTSRPTTVDSVTPIPCEQEHTGEVYISVIMTQPAGAPYPGQDAIAADARMLCEGVAFEAYVGTPYPDSRFFTYALIPSVESWAEGDRDVSCVLYDVAGPSTGSQRDSGL